MKTESPQYSYSIDEESYHGFYGSREEAATAAFDENNEARVCFTGEIEIPDPVEFLRAEILIEDIQCQGEFIGYWADDWPHTTKSQMEELEDSLRKVFGEWLDKHDLRPTFYNIVLGSVVKHVRQEKEAA